MTREDRRAPRAIQISWTMPITASPHTMQNRVQPVATLRAQGDKGGGRRQRPDGADEVGVAVESLAVVHAPDFVEGADDLAADNAARAYRTITHPCCEN